MYSYSETVRLYGHPRTGSCPVGGCVGAPRLLDACRKYAMKPASASPMMPTKISAATPVMRLGEGVFGGWFAGSAGVDGADGIVVAGELYMDVEPVDAVVVEELEIVEYEKVEEINVVDVETVEVDGAKPIRECKTWVQDSLLRDFQVNLGRSGPEALEQCASCDNHSHAKAAGSLHGNRSFGSDSSK